MRTPTVLISGAGIAGSTLAFLLARRGFRPTVAERARTLRSSGTPVDVQGAAFDAAAEMGVVPSLRDAATDVRRMAVVDARGGRVASVDLPVNGPRQIEVPRSSLARILCEASRNDAELLFDESIESLHEDEGGVHVTFERAEPRSFDLVIGCDGLHSTVRRLVFGPERDVIEDLDVYVATFPLGGPAGDPGEVVMYNAPNKAISVHPGKGREIVALMFRNPSLGAFGHRDSAQHRRILHAAFQGAGWRSDELLARLDEVDDFYFDSVSRVRLDRWSTGRVALLGDAASCVSFLGGGSSNAMVGAVVLANALAATPTDHEAAFRFYEREHRKRVDPKVRGVGYASHLLIPATSAGIRARNWAMTLWSALKSPARAERGAPMSTGRRNAGARR